MLALMTGTYPPRRVNERTRLAGRSLAQELAARGYETVGFSENPFISKAQGFDAGFAHFEERYPDDWNDSSRAGTVRADSAGTVDRAIHFVEQRRTAPYFLYVHLLPPHSPYNPPPAFVDLCDSDYGGTLDGSFRTLHAVSVGERNITNRDLSHLACLYDANLTFADYHVGRLLDVLRKTEEYSRTLVILTSDHGEAFFEHGKMLHVTTAYEEMIRVPLLVRFPSCAGAFVSDYEGVVETRAIPATVCEVLNLSDCPYDSRQSLVSGARGEKPTDLQVAIVSTHDSFGRRLRAVVLGTTKLILGARLSDRELYDLDEDPGEKVNLFDVRRREVVRLRRLLQGIQGAGRGSEDRCCDGH